MKNEAKLKEKFENFQSKGFKHIKRENHQKFKPVNDIFYSWLKKCEASGIYINKPLLKVEAMNTKNLLCLPELNGFKAWRDSLKNGN